MHARELLDQVCAPFTMGPLDDDGLLQPSAVPWGRRFGHMARPYLSVRAIQTKGSARCFFELGCVLTRASLLQLQYFSDRDDGVPEDVAADTGGEGFSWLVDSQPDWSAKLRMEVQLGALYELHAVGVAVMQGLDVAAVLREYGLQGCTDDFRRVQIDGMGPRELWAPASATDLARRES